PSADSQIGGKTVDITIRVINLPVGATAIPASNIVIDPTNAILKTALQPVSGKTNEYKATYTLPEYTSDGVKAKFDVTSTENGNYAAQSTAVSKQVSILDKYTTTVTLKVNGSTANTSITYGQDVVLTAEITSNGTLPAGTVTFAGETPVNVVDGKATLTIKKLSANKTYNAIFTPTNNDYKGSTSSDITVTVNKADLAGVLSISGTPAYNETLTADTSKLTGVTGDTLNFTYQWLRDKSEIVGKTNSTYTVTADDIGKAITVKVSAGTNYKESVSEAIIIVKAQPKYVVPTDLTVRYGDKLSAITFVKVNGDATHTAGTFSWMDSTLSVGNVGTKTFKAKFTPDDATMYETKTDIDIQVVVEKAAAPTITFPTSNGPITYGSALSTLTLTGGSTEYGTFT
ncbi:MAG: Ig-like domain repeat protein, partial [Oscillospiraceae bacterium]